jgi:hypothetical protein
MHAHPSTAKLAAPGISDDNDPAPGGAIVATAPWNVLPDDPFNPVIR